MMCSHRDAHHVDRHDGNKVAHARCNPALASGEPALTCWLACRTSERRIRARGFALHRRVRRSCVASYAPARAMRGASIEVDRRRPVARLRVLARTAALARAVAAAELEVLGEALLDQVV